MENEKKAPESYGEIVKPNGQKLQVTDYLQADYVDNRVISVSTIEDGSVLLVVENPASTGRNTTNQMWLSEESAFGLLNAMHMYYLAKGVNMEEAVKACVNDDKINYRKTPNLGDVDTAMKKALKP